MKTCKKGLHQYPDNLDRCPECTKASRKARLGDGSKTKICKWGHEHPDNLERCPECSKIAQKKYRATPKAKAKKKAREETPKYKEIRRLSNQTPQVKEAKRKWQNDPENKALVAAASDRFCSSPTGQASRKVSRGKRTKIAAQGDLTPEQWIERLEEFDHKCAYCSIELLTMEDAVDSRYHPQYLTLEHIVPLLEEGNQKGQHTKDNVIPACRGCNNSKLSKDVWVWMKEKDISPSEKLLLILMKINPKKED